MAARLGGMTLPELVKERLTVEDMKEFLLRLDAGELRSHFQEMEELLRGEFNPDPSKLNIYDKLPSGLVVSRELMQDRPKNPTVGLIIPGDYNFKTGNYTETMTVLAGLMIAGIDSEYGRGPNSFLERNGSIIAPAGTILRLDVDTNNVLYLCQYEPKRQDHSVQFAFGRLP